MRKNIAIIGYGRFGSLLAEMLKKDGEIHIISRTKVKNRNYKKIDYKDLKNMDWVILAAPISAFLSVIKKIAPLLKPEALVMDVCSVKVWPCRWMKNHLPKTVKILGAHPMFGPDSARYGLKGLSMVFCPVRLKNFELREVMGIFREKELSTVVMSPAAHDREAAISLALVHFIGRGLGKMKIKPQQVSTLGYDRLLAVNETVENDTMELFRDMHRYNPFASKLRKKYLNYLSQIDECLNRGIRIHKN